MSDTLLKFLVRMAVSGCFSVLLCQAQQYTTYSDIWTQDNGDGAATIWGNGYTEDDPGHGVQHNMFAGPTLYGPNGTNSNSVWAAGNTGAVLVHLAADWGGGDYQTRTTHQAASSLSPGVPGPTQSSTIGLRLSSYVFAGVVMGIGCEWQPSGPGCPGTCGQAHIIGMFGGQCYSPPNNYKACLVLQR